MAALRATFQVDLREEARSGHFSCDDAACHVGAAEPLPKDIYMCRNVLGQVLVLVSRGVLLIAITMCTLDVYAMPEYFSLITGMMCGALLAASDPFLVLGGIKEIGADPRVITIIMSFFSRTSTGWHSRTRLFTLGSSCP